MDSEIQEPKTIGLTTETKIKLEKLKANQFFKEMQDAYKFGVGLALATGNIATNLKNTVTIYGTGDLDPDKTLFDTVKALRSEITNEQEPIYKTIERLAEWGVKELSAMSENGTIDFDSIMKKISQKF